MGLLGGFGESKNMINNVNSSTSELLKQIQRLSSQTKTKPAPKPETHALYKGNEVNTRAENIKKILNTIKTNNLEKTQKGNTVAGQKIDGMKKVNNDGKNLQIAENYKPIPLEKISFSRQVGSFLDTYV
ncbi:MAG: hypothetical protein HKUEN01_07230 [Candidatus Kuenenia stuttgartiensis]|nr:MAG: hypothetical protein HKUEN01_07230 [Candidatus Kuenenia stuttgartiensis]SOH04907.1 hypothetical protein KSMBR1_2420 [Candidatus Kuenenia stuttgartiensis]